jgi:hypothetical protein
VPIELVIVPTESVTVPMTSAVGVGGPLPTTPSDCLSINIGKPRRITDLQLAVFISSLENDSAA